MYFIDNINLTVPYTEQLSIFEVSIRRYLITVRIMETLKVKANQSKRTFTIRKYIDGEFFVKYRTIQMSQDEFDSNEMNTENDWKQFLKSDDYYEVK